jgi:hypothetical protein
MTERLNGLRIPLLVNGVTLVPVAIVLINMWADIRELKSQRVTGERFARMEAKLEVATAERYRSSDADRDLKRRDDRMDYMDRQIQELRQRR